MGVPAEVNTVRMLCGRSEGVWSERAAEDVIQGSLANTSKVAGSGELIFRLRYDCVRDIARVHVLLTDAMGNPRELNWP